MQIEKWPEKGDLVVCTVKKVMDFGVFVELDEFGRKEGLIHISEVASGWIKYIGDHVREGQKIVCKVLHVDAEKAHIDLSLKDVNDHKKREKIQSWKNEQKAKKWMGFVADSLGIDDRKVIVICEKLFDNFGSMYSAFEEVAMFGPKVLIDIGLEETLAKKIHEIATENVKIPFVEISGIVNLTCPKPDGINVIKRALKAATSKAEEDVEITASYVGAPRYRIHVRAPDYKKAENTLKKSAESAIKIIKKAEGFGSFHRHDV